MEPQPGAASGFADEATSPHVALDAAPETKGRLLRALLSRTDDVYGVFDLTGAALYISPAVERLLGWRPEEIIGACTRARLAAALLCQAVARATCPLHWSNTPFVVLAPRACREGCGEGADERRTRRRARSRRRAG